MPVKFKIGQYVLLDDGRRARIEGIYPRNVRILTTDGDRLVVGKGDVSLPEENAALIRHDPAHSHWHQNHREPKLVDGNGNYLALIEHRPDDEDNH